MESFDCCVAEETHGEEGHASYKFQALVGPWDHVAAGAHQLVAG